MPNVDTLTQKNSFFFTSYKEQDGLFPLYTKKDFNISYIIPDDVRYNNASSWNGLFVPSFAYMGSTADFSYEHHSIYYKATCLTNCGSVGIENTVVINTAVLGDAYPNPVIGNASINIPLNVSDKNAKLTVKNILGQELASYNNLTSGSSDITINTSNFPSGIYLYTLETGSNVITKKFSINK